MELRDQNGLTEKEYLERYSPGAYERPSVTVDAVVFQRVNGSLRVLLIRRGGHPFLGCWALPGGFAQPGETLEEAAARELEEESHLSGLALAPLNFVSTPGRDPRTWTMTQPYAALVGQEAEVKAGDDAAEAKWFDIALQKHGDRLQMMLTGGGEVLYAECGVGRVGTPFGEKVQSTLIRSQGIAFDHGRILCEAVFRLEY